MAESYPALSRLSSFCVWPASLSTIALNAPAFHSKDNQFVDGPFVQIYRMSRYRLFLLCLFVALFVYFFIPTYLFNAISIFSWITCRIAPNNVNLSALTGMQE